MTMSPIGQAAWDEGVAALRDQVAECEARIERIRRNKAELERQAREHFTREAIVRGPW